MIGILLALQVNNWNQQRKDRIEEKQILRAISKDMHRIHDFCQVCGDRHQVTLNSSHRLLNVIHSNNRNMDPSQIEHDLKALFNRCFVGEGLSENIYDVLMGSDQLELLASRELRDELANLDSWIGTLQPYDILQAEFVDDQLAPFVNQYVDRTRLHVTNSSFETIIDTSSFEKRFESQLDNLLDQRTFANLLTDLTIHTKRVMVMYDFVENSIGDIDSILVDEMPELRSEIMSRSKE